MKLVHKREERRKQGREGEGRRGLENGAPEWWEKMRQDQKNHREGMKGLWREEDTRRAWRPENQLNKDS